MLRLDCDSGNAGWRGEVLHTQTGETCPILNLTQLAAFVAKHAPGLPAGAPTLGAAG